MTDEKPMHWGSWKGRVVGAIVQQGSLTWDELLELTGLSSDSLNTALSELYHLNQIEKIGEKYRVCRELYGAYKDFFKRQASYEELSIVTEKLPVSRRFSAGRRNEIVNWINQWKKVEKLGFPTDLGHFFLEGRHLDAILKGLISNSKIEVLVVNPYVANCDLSNTLREASKSGVRVKLVTRAPNVDRDRYWEQKKGYHSTLKKEGITLTYNNKAHAKLVAIDRAVAIVSSMNFYSGSSAGSSWEAGLVTIEETVVESIVDSILALLEMPESKELT